MKNSKQHISNSASNQEQNAVKKEKGSLPSKNGAQKSMYDLGIYLDYSKCKKLANLVSDVCSKFKLKQNKIEWLKDTECDKYYNWNAKYGVKHIKFSWNKEKQIAQFSIL